MGVIEFYQAQTKRRPKKETARPPKESRRPVTQRGRAESLNTSEIVSRTPAPMTAFQRKLLAHGWSLLDALHTHARPIWKAKLRAQDTRLDDHLTVELGPDLQLRIRDADGKVIAESTPHRRRVIPNDVPWKRW